MEINRLTNTPNFQANYIAKCEELNLYKLTDKADFQFIKELPKKIQTKDLYEGLSKAEYDRWNEMIEYAVDNAQKKGHTTYIETFNNKICGILTYTPGQNIILDCICTWPTEFGKKVKFAGQTLFYQIFNDFQQTKGRKIKLDAITNGPFDTVSKYEKLGFKKTSNMHPTKVEMETTAPKIKETLNELKQNLNYTKVNEEKVFLTSDLYM